MKRTVCTLVTTGAAIAALGGICSAQVVQGVPSVQTREMIMGPLIAEIPPQRLTALGFGLEAVSPAYLDYRSPRPNAARFARAGLLSEPRVTGLGPLSAFERQSATLAQTETSRLSLSLAGPGQPDSLFFGASPDYVEAGGLRLTGFRDDLPRNMGLRYETSFDVAGSGNGLDIGIAPRAGVSLGSFGPAYEAGATLRIGDYVREELLGRPAWWLFAGADREAVRYNPGQRFDIREAFAHGDYAMIGDAQAGVALRAFGADFSLAYVMRETSYAIPTHSWESKEDFAAFSMSWRH